MIFTSQSFLSKHRGFLSTRCHWSASQLAPTPLLDCAGMKSFKVYTHIKKREVKRLRWTLLVFFITTTHQLKIYGICCLCLLHPPPIASWFCENICTKKQKVNKTSSIKYNLIYYKNIIQKELVQSEQIEEKYNKILSSITEIFHLFASFPSKTTIASFVFIGKIDFFHPNHNSILKIVGNRTQEVRITRYVGFPIFTYFGNPATKIRTGQPLQDTETTNHGPTSIRGCVFSCFRIAA